MFGKKKNTIPQVAYDPEKQIAVVKCSICNGEKVAGFKDKATGKVTEVCAIRDDSELEKFMEMYNISSIVKVY